MARAPQLLIGVLMATLALLQQPATAQSLTFSIFERVLESLQRQAGIPGLSAVIVHNGSVVWERGLGYQELESSVVATPDTPYLIADLTQTFAAVLLMQCVERGTLRLEDPLWHWSQPGNDATVGQVLAHLSSTTPAIYKYDPTRFALLTPAVDACGAVPARTRVVQSVIEYLGMINTVPGRDLDEPTADLRQLFDERQLSRYRDVLSHLAVPYKIDRRRPARSEFPPKRIDASTGLVSTVRDLAKYDAALDNYGYGLLRSETLDQMWSNPSQPGSVRPTGLGWFVQNYNGERLVWHFGNIPDAYSSLILKIPSRRLTLILLANSDGLSAPFDLPQGDVSASLFAVAFLRLFL